ncbi:Glycoside-Pentoside-Hexuronide (GPH):Cation Symporter Family [Phytophthora infestans T30-4]|uniref:Glycoside-Pentoside-Hexuronide (GPH):Cation Symporter Family n=2 Tax=Phytophthora infestans TaxID=4787 RepID=D0MS20_PHYIT|nr:Glycoside-Pentoside-Hexuronide (GPH):Cation Symporter Family [Phytophthora infestans T30-4]EEY58289.1 Glycoside-Pentoside-Hexuronide (GPH):Cation Symporter Family [Phytophthora infestans T30-4]KAF4045071.1 MFS/sugar transport protein [Phytophthora infestans]KAF4127167.1 MFS/sugar transport protein [Phytophthora infestans]|eukprot:XP_002909475.1 Glycoside-Pentoside-Hexuronide (GPH):Cation Symporter Family [Phytophthora infestans T30-4]
MSVHLEVTTPTYNPAESPPHLQSTALGLPEQAPRLSTFSHLDLDDSGQSEHTVGCSVGMLVLLSLPRMATNMAWSAQWAALGPYLGTMLPRFAVQLTQLIGPLSGILVAPTIGVLSDRSLCKWGRRRPFLVYGAVTSAACWVLMGYTRELGELLGDSGDHRPWTAWLTILFYTWMDITVNVVQTPAFLIISDFAGDRQTLGASIGQASSTLGSIWVAGYIYIFGAAHLTLRWFLGMLSVTMLASVGAVCVFAKEEVPVSKDVGLGSDEEAPSAMKRIGEAFSSIFHGLKTLPRTLAVYCLVFFCIQFGFTAYNGSKGQFFGIEVFGGNATDADVCGPSECSEDQERYNDGVQIAGGLADLLFNVFGYLYSWVLPLLVYRLGARWVITVACIPQSLLMVMAFTKVVAVDVTIVVLTAITQATIFALIVPLIVHVFGTSTQVGMYVGAVNSANCVGQLVNFLVGAALVETSLGYALPVFVGGAFSLLGALISFGLLRIDMHSM